MQKAIKQWGWASIMVLAGAVSCAAGDWPMWRHDAVRSAVTDEKLPDELNPQWVVEYPPQQEAWPDQAARGYMMFDVSYKPVTAGKRMFVGSAAEHCLKALNTDTGREEWRFYADAPVRFAAVCSGGKVWFVSDDGCLYCLKADSGTLLWKYIGGADNRKIIGNGHLVSLWPARGGPALADGTVYFAASVWPFVGAFLHAVDAETGKAVWVNSGAGAQWIASYALQGTGMLVRPGMYGNTPQGYLLVTDNRVGVPQGRNAPQLFDRKTGELLWHNMYGMHEEHHPEDYWFALKAGRSMFSGPMLSGGVGLDTAKLSYENGVGHGITGEDAIYVVSSTSVCARATTPGYRPLWTFDLPSPAAPTGPGSYIKAGANLYIPGANGKILILKDVDTDQRSLVVGPAIPGGNVWDMLASDGKLFTVSRDGRITCYGGNKVEPKTNTPPAQCPMATSSAAKKQVETILAAARPPEGGWFVVLDLEDGNLAKALHLQSKSSIIVVDRDEKKTLALRNEAAAAGVYGRTFNVHTSEASAFGFPPYLADMILMEQTDTGALLKDPARIAELYRVLRPYTGTLIVPMGRSKLDDIRKAVIDAKLDGPVEVAQAGTWALIKRTAAPFGTADWTHNNANAGNTLVGFDKLVKMPLGVLWFGGPGNDNILPRHGRGPAPTVAAGRVFIEGPDLIRALDAYTGRILWEREFRSIGEFYNTGGKQLGTHETGPNYCTAPDTVYVITPQKCMALDAATGRTTMEFALPPGVEPDSLWATVRFDGDWLVTTIRPVDVKREFKFNARQGAGAQWLAIYDRRSGKNLWARKASQVFRSNGVAAGDGKVFCIDGTIATELTAAEKVGVKVAGTPVMQAFDAATGKELWKTDKDVYGTWLSYSSERKLLVQAGCGGGDPETIAGHNAVDGSQLWHSTERFLGPPLLHHEVAIPQHGVVVGLADGKARQRPEPITGTNLTWTSDASGCGFQHGGENMLFHRVWSTGGYTDLANPPRQIGLGGFRSGCTANMIPADGIVAIPDYTKDCECQFKNQTSLGLIHMPDASAWSCEFDARTVTNKIKRLGLNFGAPGDRVSPEGTLWLDCPDFGGPSPRISVKLEPGKMVKGRNWIGEPTWRTLTEKPGFAGRIYHIHSTVMKGGPLPWVCGSGLDGVTSVTLSLTPSPGEAAPADYTVRLYFAEPDMEAKPGSRVFSVAIQDKPVLPDLDVAKEAGGHWRGLVKEFKNIKLTDSLSLTFTPGTGNALISGLELILQE